MNTEQRPVPPIEYIQMKLDGTLINVEVVAFPINFNYKNRTFAFVRDITERTIADERMKKDLRERETLLRELYHRTKNNMQVIRSILALQSAEMGEEVRNLVREVDVKIESMSLVHQMLYQSKNLSSIRMRKYLEDLHNLVFGSFRLPPGKILMELDIQDIEVSIDIAVPCGLLINELMMNALKYAFPDDRKGRILIRLRKKPSHEIELEFSDNGVSVPDGFDFRKQKTFGIKSIIGIVEHQLGGSVAMDTGNGLSYRITFKDSDNKSRLI